MKIITRTLLGACLLATVSVSAQSKSSASKTSAPQKADHVADFKKRNPNVKNFSWAPGMVLTIEKTDGTKETYNMDISAQEQKARATYGDIPKMPPPPPPVEAKSSRVPPPPPPVEAKLSPVPPPPPPVPATPPPPPSQN